MFTPATEVTMNEVFQNFGQQSYKPNFTTNSIFAGEGADKIRHLTDEDLLARFGRLVQTERKITHLVLQCIAEVDSRKLYFERGSSSLYEFLIQQYGYSPSAAIRRIESARLLRDVPEISKKIEEGITPLHRKVRHMQQCFFVVYKLVVEINCHTILYYVCI